MKMLPKIFRVVPFAVLFFAGALSVKAYGEEPNVGLYMGSFVAMDAQQHQITAKVEVPGASGTNVIKTMPFKIDEKTTIQICFNTEHECDSYVGMKGWDRLTDLESKSDFNVMQKNLALVQDSKNDRTLHVVILYTK